MIAFIVNSEMANAMAMHNLYNHLNMAFHYAQFECVTINNEPEPPWDVHNTLLPGKTMYWGYDCFFNIALKTKTTSIYLVSLTFWAAKTLFIILT